MTGPTGNRGERGDVRPARSVHELARQQLEALCRGLEIAPGRQQTIAALFDRIAAQCGDQPLDRPPRWSGMSDDCSPVEWSVAFRDGAPDIRVLVEAQRDPASVANYWEASRDLTRWAVAHLGADDGVLQRVIGGFEPTTDDAYTAAYHGFEFRHDGSVRTKVYLNPALGGDRWTVARAAVEALGLRAPVDALVAAVGPLDLPLVAFDLEHSDLARVKLYLRSSSIDVLEAVGELSEPPCGSDFRPLVEGIFGTAPIGRSPFVALHLRAGAEASETTVVRPERAVLSVPVFDESQCQGLASERISAVLGAHGLDAGGYQRVVHELAEIAFPGEPACLHSWISSQREPNGSPRVTVYFRLRAFVGRYGWLGADPVRTWPIPVETEIIEATTTRGTT